MSRLEVHKFGGTSVGGAERIRAVAQIVGGARGECELVVVVSAMAGFTDSLGRAARAAAAQHRDEALAVAKGLYRRHEEAWEQLGLGTEAPGRRDCAQVAEELYDLLRGTALVGELTQRVLDRILSCGEKLSARLVAAAVTASGTAATALDADTFLETDDRFGMASPLAGVVHRTVDAAIRGALAAGQVPVVTGYCGLGPTGATTTLGRGGSDLSATLVAQAIRADEVTIWTDVDGVFTANPRVEPRAVVIPHLNYREAAEMSYYGAKVLYQRSMIPAVASGIPVRVRNSFRPQAPGTLVDGRFTRGPHPVKAVSAIRGLAMVTVQGQGMAGVPGVAARLFGALAAESISVTMISQASSESSITLAIPSHHALAAERSLKQAFRDDLSSGGVDEILVRTDVGLLAAVGLGMAHHPGIAARVCAALGGAQINILGIAQGSSELNMTLAVDDSDLDTAVRAVHREFHLDQDGRDRGTGGVDDAPEEVS